MSNWNLALPFLRMCVGQPRQVLKGLYQFTTVAECRRVATGLGFGAGLPTIDLLDLVPNFDEQVDHYTYLDGTSRVTDIALLGALARRTPEGRYLEMGSWRGESLANVAPLIREVISISFSDEQMRAAGMSEAAVRNSHLFSRSLPNHRRIQHNSQTYDYAELRGTCDLVFVDADHHHQGVAVDTRNAFTLLKNEESIIVWHDYGLGYETVNWEVLRGILEGATPEQRGRIFHVSNTLCAVYLPAGIHVAATPASSPNKVFRVHVSARRL